jgi:hypothetical protein
MAKETARVGGRLIGNGGKLPPELSLSPHSRFRRRSRAWENYRKYPSIRIDNVTKRIAANPLTHSAKLLKNNTALSVTRMSRFSGNGIATGRRSPGGQDGEMLERADPQGLWGLFRVGA